MVSKTNFMLKLCAKIQNKNPNGIVGALFLLFFEMLIRNISHYILNGRGIIASPGFNGNITKRIFGVGQRP